MAFHKININSTDFELAPKKVKSKWGISSTNENLFIPYLSNGPGPGIKEYGSNEIDYATAEILVANNSGLKDNPSFFYNPSQNAVGATKFIGDLDGTATNATYITVESASTTDASYYIQFVNGPLGNRTSYTDVNLLYNPKNNVLTVRQVNGKLYGPVQTTRTSTDASYYISFVNDSTTSMRYSYVDTNLYYNPKTNILTVGNVKITGTNRSTATIKADAATNMYVDIGGNTPFVIKYDDTEKFVACGSSFSNLVNLGTSARKWANVYATTFHGDLNGNATTATTATNAKNIIVAPASTTDASYYIQFVNGPLGSKKSYIDTTLYYNPYRNVLTVPTVNGNLNGAVQTTTTTTNATYFISFVNGSGDGMRYSYVNSGLYYNPSTNELSAGGGFYERSDERLKDFQEDIEVNFSYLHNIPKKYYSWKADSAYARHIGTSAQEVQKYYPELVNTDDTGYLTMNYDKLSVVALKAIDVLHEEVTELKKENAELKERLARLEELILNK